MSNFPIHHGIKLAQNGYIENAFIETLETDPSGPYSAAGRIWFNSTDGRIKQLVLDENDAIVVRTIGTYEELHQEIVDEATTRETNDDAIIGGAGLESDGSYAANGSANYIASSTSLKDADNDLDAAIKVVSDDLADEVTRATNAEDALDGRVTTIEGSYIKKDGTVAMTGDLNLDSHAVTNLSAPVNSGDAVNKAYVDSIVGALGSAFNYVGTVSGGATSGTAYDMGTLPSDGKDTGDYYKVAQSGYFKVGAGGTPFYANANDGLVWNTVGGVDKIDSTDSSVTGTSDYISVTGSTDTGYTVDIDSVFKGRVSTLETDLAQEILDRAAADETLQDNIDAEALARTNADNDLQDAIDAEALARTNADNDLQDAIDAEALARANADTDLDSNITAIEGAVGLSAVGAYIVPTGTTYLDETTSVANALSTLDTAVAGVADDLVQEALDRAAADETLQDNIDAEALARANADDTLQDNIDAEALARTNADETLQDNIDAEALARTNADETLQDNIDAEALARTNADDDLQDAIDAEALARTNADTALQGEIDAEEIARANADTALQSELDATQSGAGLNTDGTYPTITGTNYLNSTTSLVNADSVLDTKIKAFLDAYNGNHYYVEKSTPATEHTIEHNLGTAKLTFTVMVDRDGSGDWRNDVVSVKHTDNNTLTVYLSVAKKVRVSVQKVDNISI